MRYRCLLLFLAVATLDLPAPAQVGYPGGYPPYGYPGGYPGGGIGLPIPHRKKKNKDAKDAQAEQANLKQIEGMLRKMDDHSIVIESSDTRILNVKRSDKTKFLNSDGEAMKPAELKPGDHLMIEISQDDEGFFYAVNVNFQKKGTAQEQAAAAQPVETSTQSPSGKRDDDDRPVLRRNNPAPEKPEQAAAPAPAKAPEQAPQAAQTPPASQPAPAPRNETPAPQSAAPPPTTTETASEADPTVLDVDGRPRLRRGKPAPRMTSDPIQMADAKVPSANTPATTPQRPPQPGAEPPSIMVQSQRPQDPNIAKAADMAVNFTETLPNYVCQEYMARFISTTHVVQWQPQDVVSMEVVYESGREQYRKIAINNKPTNKKMEELPGARSTGEFGTVLVDLFSPNTAADFRFRKESTIEGRSALVYDFSVEHDGSHWRIEVASQSVMPPYKGAIWIDKQTHRVLRIEMETRNMPSEFPMDKVESAVDYDFVRLGDARQFLLPVHAETLMCQRDTNNCSRNSIDFRNYHKYSGESTITFGKAEEK